MTLISMKTSLMAMALAFALSACDRSNETPAPEAATANTSPPSASTGAAQPANTTPTATPPAAAATDEPPPASTAADGDGAGNAVAEQTVSDSIDRMLGDHAQYQAAIASLQQAVATKNRAAVAALIAYPFTTTLDGRKTTLKDPAAFTAQYDRIITPAVADVIAKERYADVMVSAKGVMFGSGEVWLNGVCRDKACAASDVKIIAIQSAARY